MSNTSNKKFYFSGGLFFSLLTESGYKNKSQNNEDILDKLIYVINGVKSFKKASTLKSYASKYKSNKFSTDNNQPFVGIKKKDADSFDADYKNNSSILLKRMIDFVSDDLSDNNEKLSELVNRLISFIMMDDHISEEDLIFVSENCVNVYKKDLANPKVIELEAFLLGILHYIINNHHVNFDSTGEYEFIPQVIQKTNEIIIIHNYSPDQTETKNMIQKQSDISVDRAMFREEYSKYIDTISKHYRTVKTILSKEPIDIDSFYICSDLTYSNRNNSIEITNVTINDLEEISNYIIITGAGGSGKTLMFRHLFADVCNYFAYYQKIPIFVNLYRYTDHYKNMSDFVLSGFSIAGKINKSDKLEVLLNAGKCILFFDGLDEMPKEYISSFHEEINDFINAFPDNMFLISSRPSNIFKEFERFTELSVKPFNKEQSEAVIKRFIKLKCLTNISDNHLTDFIERISESDCNNIPLRITILYRIFEETGMVPNQSIDYFLKFYEVIVDKFNNPAKGCTLETKLDSDQFKDLFAEFCYIVESEYSYNLTEIQFKQAFNKISKSKINNIKYRDFKTDIIQNLELMEFDDNKYCFLHNSFADYFCAYHYSFIDDENYKNNFSKMHQKEELLENLYELDSNRVESLILLPYLETVFNSTTTKTYGIDFIKKMYNDYFFDVVKYTGPTEKGIISPDRITFSYKIKDKRYEFILFQYFHVFPFFSILDSDIEELFAYIEEDFGKEVVDKIDYELRQKEEQDGEYLFNYIYPYFFDDDGPKYYTKQDRVCDFNRDFHSTYNLYRELKKKHFPK